LVGQQLCLLGSGRACIKSQKRQQAFPPKSNEALLAAMGDLFHYDEDGEKKV